MATIPLKDITFPGLDNTYTIPEIDDTLSTAGKAADAKKTGDEILALNEDLDELNSNFTALESSDGAVPSAEQILSDKGVTDSVPYHYRKTGGDGADRLYDQIVGGTVNWNQLVQNGNFEDATSWNRTGNVTSFTVANNKATLVCTQATDNTFIDQYNKNVISGHKYLVGFDYEKNAVTPYAYWGTYPNVLEAQRAFSALSGRYEAIVSAYGTNTTRIRVGMRDNSATGEWTYSIWNVMMFDLTAMFGNTIADYIYNLEQTTAGVGVAFFKSLFPNDYYEYNSGELVSVSGLSAHVMRDVDNNIIRSYPLDSTLTLRGIPKLVDGKIKWDGDVYDADGTVTRKYGIVDLGTLDWAYSNGYFNADVSINVPTKTQWEYQTGQCSRYKVERMFYVINDENRIDNCIAWYKTAIRVSDSAYADAATFKTAMSGVMLVYELATPTTEEADPYKHLQQCDPSGTEEYVSTGIVPIGHNSFYPENLKSKIEGLPWNFASLIAPTESTFVATQNYTTGSLFIVDNVLYKATSNIANGGTITPNTNCTATTLAEIISALA